MDATPVSAALSRTLARLASPLRAASPLFAVLVALLLAPLALAGEANLVLPDLSSQTFIGLPGDTLLSIGLLVCLGGLAFGAVIYMQLKNLPIHAAMREVSELIYETCKTYMITQGKFLILLKVFIGLVIVVYFGFFAQREVGIDPLTAEPIYGPFGAGRVLIVLAFTAVGILGSYAVAWFGIRVNTFANGRTAWASLSGKPFPCYSIPLKAGMSIGMVLISVELMIMLLIILALPADLAGPSFIGFAIGESLGASALRIAGGIFTKIADIGSDLMKIVFNIKEDDARNPGVIADCTGDNAGDSVGPTADGFETYGVTGVALITFTLMAVPAESVQVQILVWLFAMRVMMIIASGGSYLINESFAKARFGNAKHFNYETPLTNLVWLTSIVSIVLTYIVSWLLIPDVGGDTTMWWKLATIISCGTIAGAIIPEVVKIFTSTDSAHVREVVTSSREGGASLNILSGLTAGNFSAFWMGMIFIVLMGVAYLVSLLFPETLPAYRPDHVELMVAPAVFAFGLVAFGFLGMGPVTIAVDSYGPVTDNAQSVYELALIEEAPGVREQVQKDFGVTPDFAAAKHALEENDGAGNTFKATAKPVLIGTAVVGATTMIFAIIMMLTDSLNDTAAIANLSMLHPPFLLGLLAGGSVIYWFCGASTQAVITGAYRAVEFIKANIRLDGVTKASTEDSKKVVEICTKYAQKGMFNIFVAVFFGTLAFAFLEPFFFIGYLIAIAFFGLFQAVFMANAGGAWDNAKKIVEVDLKEKGTPLHEATVVGDTVGDPFKDTSSVALNPIIKFTTLFGLLAVELAVSLNNPEFHSGKIETYTSTMTFVISGIFLAIMLVFVWRSFYAMRIRTED